MRVLSLIVLCLLLEGSARAQATKQDASNWVTLLDGTTLNGWNTTGNANWKVADGAIEASSGNGMLVTPANYSNFEPGRVLGGRPCQQRRVHSLLGCGNDQSE